MKIERAIVRTSVLALILVMIVSVPASSPFLGNTAASGSRAPIEKVGDWAVVGTEAFDNQTVLLTGNLTVGTGATLRFTNSSLNMNLSKDRQFHIIIKDGGRLVLNGTVVRSMAPGKRYDLIVSNASINARGAVVSNFTSVSLSHASAVLDTTNLVDNGATSLTATASQLEMTGSGIVVQGHVDGLYAYDSSLTLVSPMLKAAGPQANIGINISDRSDVNIKDGRVYNFSTGIFFKGRSLTVDGLRVTGSGDTGLKQSFGTSNIANSQFYDNKQSIFCLGGTLNITAGDIRAQDTAIYLGPCTARIDHTTVWSSHTGIYAIGAKAELTADVITDNAVGLDWASSANGTIVDDVFNGNGLGVLFEAPALERHQHHRIATGVRQRLGDVFGAHGGRKLEVAGLDVAVKPAAAQE